MTQKEITRLLAARHAGDIFVAQCKNGSTYFPTDGKLLIFDAWAMPRSYTQMCWIGYEIKVSRADYLSDKKLLDYLRYCSHLYVVCPHGLIKKEEVPDPIGLLYVFKNEAGLRIVKHAIATQKPDILSVYDYIMISRCSIRNDRVSDNGVWSRNMMTGRGQWHYSKVPIE